MAGPVTMGGAPLLSAIWFPVHQRTTATAVGVLSGTLGVAVSFIIGNYVGILQPVAEWYRPPSQHQWHRMFVGVTRHASIIC